MFTITLYKYTQTSGDKEAHFFCFFWMYFRCENSVFSLKVALFSITLSTMT